MSSAAATLTEPVATGRSRISSLARNVAGALGGNVAVLVIGLATSVLLNRTLGPEAKGSYATILTASQLVALVASLGLAKSITFQLAQPNADRRGILRAGVTMALAAAVVGALLVAVLAGTWPAEQTRDVLAGSMGVLMLLTAVQLAGGCALGALRGLNRFRESNVLQPLGSLAFLALLLLAAAAGSLGASGALVCKLGGALLLLALAVRVLHREGLSFAPTLDRTHARAVLGYGLGYFGYTFFQNLNYRFDTLLVSSLAGSAATGWYTTATGLAEIVWYLPNAVGLVLFPVAAGLGARESDALIAQICRWSFHAVLLATAALTIFASTGVALLYGREFLPAVGALHALAIGIVTNGLFQVLGVRLAARQQLGALTWITLAGFVANLLANLLFIPRWGFVGAAWASSISYTLTGFLSARHFIRQSELRWRELFCIPRAEFAGVVRRLRHKFYIHKS